MFPLPILNVQLNACHEDWQQMTPVALGHHCAQCDRVVLDFTNSTQADLAAAFQNSPDGRVCGRFRPEQLAPRLLLRQKLRRFLVALVLVCGLGLSGQEALAQLLNCSKTPIEFASISKLSAEAIGLPSSFDRRRGSEFQKDFVLGMVVEQMPEFRGGQAALTSYLQKNLRYPDGATLSGRVFVTFIITPTGSIKDTRIVKGLEPLLDKEVVRVVNLMPTWKPGNQSGKAVDVGYTLPITFYR
jgi:protein TonB